MKHLVSTCVVSVLACSASLAAQRTDSWPSWRGPSSTGHARGSKPPVRWSERHNIKWKVALPGLGLSSPVLHGDRIYLTTAVATSRVGKANTDEPQHRLAQPRPERFYQFAVLAVDRRSGAIVWRKNVAETVPHEGGHSTNSHASSSPVTDGKYIYANFGSRGLYCLDANGAVVWSKDLGQMRTRRQYGEGSSPAVHGDRLVVNHDHEGDSFVAVFDKNTGKELWRKARDEVTSWSTPLIRTVDGRPQAIINATTASRGYDLESGEIVWHLGGMTVNCIPSPVERDGVVYLMSGYRGRALQAVQLKGAAGDIAGTKNVLWQYSQRVSYVPSALLYDDHYYFVRGNTGVLSCLDAKTGKPHFEGQKLDEIRSVYASPVGAGGHVYVTSREGVTQVLRHGAEFEPVATNRLDAAIDASLAIVGDAIYLRSREHLYCIAHVGETQAKTENESPVAGVEYWPHGFLGTRKELTASLSTGDLDGDGDLDIAVANGRHWPGQNLVFLNDGKAGFGAARPIGEPTKSYATELADLDGDGDLDIVVGNDKEPSRILWNDGKASFSKGPAIGRVSSTRSVTLADLDGKNGIDVIFSNRGAPNLICFNDGRGGFEEQRTFGDDDPTIRTAVGDVDGDGDLDIAVANRGRQNFVYLNDGKGGFGERRNYGSGSDSTRGIAIADIDRDGHLDIVNANIDQRNAVHFGDGKGGFSRVIEFGGRSRSFSVAITDVNADGRPDLLVATAGGRNRAWIQREAGGFASTEFGPRRGGTYHLIAADWNGDGRPEIATANSGVANAVFTLPDQKPQSLFNGVDLSGWHADIPRADKQKNLPASFVAERGLLISRGRPQGHLITDASHRDYRLVVEYRWPGKPGNCGILVHASKPRMLYKMFPQSIECQLHRGNAGDFWCIGEDIRVPDMLKRRGPQEKWGVIEGKARRIANLTNGSEKPNGEWNTMVIVCRGRSIDVWVNGDHVNNGFDCTADRGQIAIQAEGAACEFRRLELMKLIR